jgi:3-dehydroquinate synthase
VAPYLQQIAVRYQYPVYFTRDLFSPANRSLVEAVSGREPQRRHRVVFILERAVSEAFPSLVDEVHQFVRSHRDELDLVAEPRLIPGGEACKNDFGFVMALQEDLASLAMDRHSYVVAVAGGALLDAVGFAAAICHRGLRHVRVPTTVLAQADSGVGVKNGVNHLGRKNFLGTFAPPFAVLNDSRFLEGLPRRDLIAGMAEAVKVALIRDAEFFCWLEANVPALRQGCPDLVAHLVRRAAELHLDHIARSGDPFEFGSARPLDFGHWAAHKLEVLSDHRLRHGEAVAIGMALDARYSAETGLLASGDLERVLATLEALGLRLWDEALQLRGARGRRRVLDGLAEFREHLGGELTVTLLERIGRGVEVHEVDEQIADGAIDWLAARQGRP